MTGPGDGGNTAPVGAAALATHLDGVFTANAFQVVV